MTSRTRPATTRRWPSPSPPRTRRSHEGGNGKPALLSAPKDGGRAEQPDHHDDRRREGRARPRRRRHRGHHLVHEHLEPVGDDRRGAARQEGRREGPTSASRGSRPRWLPGSKVVSDYYERAELTPYLDKLGFNLVGYGCTTCIGNSGPLITEVSDAVNENDLAVVSVLSGNRNFEGRINPDVKMNYLASPPLVVAYALAGLHGRRPVQRPAGPGHRRQRRVPEGHLAVAVGDRGGHRPRDHRRDVHRRLRRRVRRRRALASLPTPEGDTFAWDEDSTYVRRPPYFEDMPAEPSPVEDIERRPGAAQARRLGDHRPHLARRRDQEGLARPGSTSPSTASSSGTSTPTAHAAATTR